MSRAYFKEREFVVSVGENRVLFRFDLETMQKERHISISRRHCNVEYEVTLIRQGRCHADVEESHYELRPGQCLIVPPGRYHILRAQPGDFDRFCFRFVVDGPMEALLRLKMPEEKVLDFPESVDQLCGMILEIERRKNPYWNDLCTCLLKALLLQLFNLMKLDWSGGVPWQQEMDRGVTVERYIEENMGQEPTLEELAELLGVSPRQLIRVLQERFGMTFRQKLLKARMDRAAWLLRTSDLPLDRVIGEVGYSSPSAFYQVFRKTFAQTPAQYRDSFRGYVIK